MISVTCPPCFPPGTRISFQNLCNGLLTRGSVTKSFIVDGCVYYNIVVISQDEPVFKYYYIRHSDVAFLNYEAVRYTQ